MNGPTQHTMRHDGKSWEAIRSLLGEVRTGMETDEASLTRLDEDLLRTRALEFAREIEQREEEESKKEDHLLFALGKDSYAMPCEYIEEVIPLQNLVALPRTSRYIMGISSNRGVLLAVIDPKRVLNIPASELTTMHRVIVVRHDTYQVGFLVDFVHGMRGINIAQIKDLPQELNERTQRFLRGVATDDIHILNPIEVVKEIASTSEKTLNTQ